MKLGVLSLAVLMACGGDDAVTEDGTDVVVDAPTDGTDANPDAEPVELEEIHFIGRFDEMQRFIWSATRIETRFQGTGIEIELTDSGNNWFEVFVDGEPTMVLRPMSGQHTYSLAEGLPAGEHTVAIARRTETFFGVSQFHGFSGATLVPSPKPQRFIEFIGDSITAGYGVLGDSATCNFSADTESAVHAWGQLTADALGAVHAAIAYSGIGMGVNLDGDTTSTMPIRYPRMFPDQPASVWTRSYVPDVIVINLGTNDFGFDGDPGQPYDTAYVDFIQDQLRPAAPDAIIILATSPMLSDGFPAGGMHRTKLRAHLETIKTTLADPNVHVVDIPQQEQDGLGCDYHPNELTAQRMSAALVAALRPLTGW